MKKNIAIGFSDFREIIEQNYYFIDKTLFIKEVINGGKILLCTRPRRFGKTLSLSMLQYFFDIRNDYHPLFEGLAIKQTPEYERYAGKYPVISLSLKGIKEMNWNDAYLHYVAVLKELFQNHEHLLTSKKVNSVDRKHFMALMSGKANITDYGQSLRFLSRLLYQHYNQQVIVLLDEYDSPIYSAYLYGFYNESMGLLRNLIESALKDNPYLERAVVTGILRIVKESLFSGLNNPQISTILSIDELSDKIGFTEKETFQMLEYYDLADKKAAVKHWYDGYLFGNFSMYNPWSVIHFVKYKGEEKPYWVNTSDNALLRRLLLTGKSNLRDYIEDLINGKSIVFTLNEELTFSSLDNDEGAILSLLLSAGYLKARKLPSFGSRHIEYEISVPNEEVITSYERTIQHWLFEDLDLSNKEYDRMLQYLMQGEYEPFEYFFRRFFEQTVSVHDTKDGQTEVFYHALLLGMMAQLGHLYMIKSNAETGYGRYDICLIPRKHHKIQRGILIEIKLARNENAYTTALEAAENQMNKKKYQTELENYGITTVFKLCIAAYGKEFQMKEIVSNG